MAPISSSDSSTMLPQAVIEARSAELSKGAIIGLIFMGVILGLILVAIFYLYLRQGLSRYKAGIEVFGCALSAIEGVGCALSVNEEFSTFGKSFSGKDNVSTRHVSPREVWAPSPREAEILATSGKPGKSFSGKDNVIASHVSPQEVWAPSPREAEISDNSRKQPPPVDNSTIPCTTEGCTQRFATPSDLNHHMRYHNRPHQCPSCELCFGTITHLKRHINDVHDTTEKYHCPIPSCKYSIDGGKSFPRKDNLKRHMGTHTGVDE